jgi:hypothetical protein
VIGLYFPFDSEIRKAPNYCFAHHLQLHSAAHIDAMEFTSPFKIDIPVSDIPTFIFSGGTVESRKSPQYFDAENPSRNFSLSEAELLVKRVGTGLRNLGLSPGDRVLLYAGNNLHFPVLLWGTIAGGFIFTGCAPTASVQGKHRIDTLEAWV